MDYFNIDNKNNELDLEDAVKMRRKDIGKNIENRRKYLAISREELAIKLNVSKSLIGLIERGERKIKSDLLENISEILKLDLESLKIKVKLIESTGQKSNYSQRTILENEICNIIKSKDVKELEKISKMLKLMHEEKYK